MKIEDSRYPYTGSVSPLEKLRRNTSVNSIDAMLDDFDLSFLDMLSSVTPETQAETIEKRDLAAAKAAEKEKANLVDSRKEITAPPKLTLVGRTSTHREINETDVNRDMSLLKDELTPEDIQYLKQAIIPGLPILMGSVPFQTIFSVNDQDEISHQGFDVSPGLSELVQKGYKTGAPIRVELDKNSAVVLKIRNGQVSAEFVSADKAMAFAMQQGLDDLRNRMTARNLPVGTLEYKHQDNRQHRQNDDETNQKDKTD